MKRFWAWGLLIGLILAEALGTTLLKASQGFSYVLPSVGAVLIYLLVIYLLSLVLKSIPPSMVYILWSGLGTTLIILVGWLLYDEAMGIKELIGISLIVVGVIALNLPTKPSHGMK